MKKSYWITTAILFLVLSLSCEKDDICDPSTPTTPRLVIQFFDAANPAVAKAVGDLKIVGYNEDGTTVFNDSQSFTVNDTIVGIPLRNVGNTTKFNFTLNSSDTVLKRTDTLQFNYSHNDIYVSRACGFKTIFDLNGTALSPFILNNDEANTIGNWITLFEITQPNINDENETHIKIYF